MDEAARGGSAAKRELAWCVADPHLTRDDPVLGLFKRFLGGFSSEGPGTLVILGDLFASWIALPGALAPYQTDVLEDLRAIKEAGREVIFIIGNRDYFVESLDPRPFSFAGERWDLAIPTVGRIRFEHGDLINTSDHNYQRWRVFSRSEAVKRVVAALPGKWQASLARRAEKALEPTNRAYKDYSPLPELERWANGVKADGCSTAVVGHFHEDKTVAAAGLQVHFAPQFRGIGPFLSVNAGGVIERVEWEPQNGGSVSTVK